MCPTWLNFQPPWGSCLSGIALILITALQLRPLACHDDYEMGMTLWTSDNFTTTYNIFNFTPVDFLNEYLRLEPDYNNTQTLIAQLAETRMPRWGGRPLRRIPHIYTHLSSMCSDEYGLVRDLAAYVESMDPSIFLDDPILYKMPDYLANQSVFKHIHPEFQQEEVYRADEDLSDPDDSPNVYILRSQTTKVTNLFRRRQFGVLRKIPTASPTPFYAASIVFLKDLSTTSQKSVELGKEKLDVEFVNWFETTHKISLHQLGWWHCNDSVFAPCIIDNPKMAKELYPNRPEILHQHRLINPRFMPEVFSEIRSLMNSNFSTTRPHDFFMDLDNSAVVAKWVAETVDKLTRLSLKKGNNSRVTDPTSKFRDSTMMDANWPFQYSQVTLPHLSATLFGMGVQKTRPNATSSLVESLLSRLRLAPIFRDLSARMPENRSVNFLNELQQNTSGGLGGLYGMEDRRQQKSTPILGVEPFPPSKSEDHNDDEIVFEPVTPNTDSVLDKIVEYSLLTRSDLFLNPGWKTAKVPGKLIPNATLNLDEDGFLGFGPCEDPNLTETKSEVQLTENKDTTRDLVVMYLRALRTQCIPYVVESTMLLFTDKYLEYLKDGRILLDLKHTIISGTKVRAKVLRKIAKAAEFAFFAQAYHNDVSPRNPGSPPPYVYRSPKGIPISRSVRVILQTVFVGLRATQGYLRPREVFITRHLVVTLKTVFARLLQDHLILLDCKFCTHDRALTETDALHVLGLIHYMLRRVTIPNQTRNTEETFQKFVVAHWKHLQRRLEWYINPLPPASL